jgi:hypothetical protein
MVGAAAVGFVALAVDGADALRAYGAPLLLVALLGWAAFWQPHVEVTDGGVRVANTWRTVHVPWPAIEDVEGRYGLRLRTSYCTVTSWAAPAPSGRARARAGTSSAALTVSGWLEELRAAGYLDNPILERPSLQVIWHVPLGVAAALLVVASLVLPLLG